MKYNASRGGHAPGHLRDALIEALESARVEDHPWWELLEICFFDPDRQAWWDRLSPVTQANWLLGQLWNCSDIAPRDICSAMEISTGSTFARLARMLKAEVGEFESDDPAFNAAVHQLRDEARN